MINLTKFYPLFLVLVFIFCCVLLSKISIPVLDKYYEYPVSESPYPKSWMKIAAFTSDSVYITDLENLEKFKADHPDVSFLFPLEKEELFKEKLFNNVNGENPKNSSNIIVEQIGENKQLIELRIIGTKSSGYTKYEASDKEILPLTYTELGLDSAFYLVFIGVVGGTIGCVIFGLFFKKNLKPKVISK